MNIYSVIMAGGGGTRFWPVSRQETPKQLLNLSGNDNMINETMDRLNSLVDKDKTFIVTNEKQGKLLSDVIGARCPKGNILIESAARNTAPCIGYAAAHIMKQYGDGVMCVFPSDHYIKDNDEFINILNKAINVAEKGDNLVTIGIEPTFPSTGYGYIKSIENEQLTIENEKVGYKVEEFVEKPDHNTAKGYIDSGNYYWNSGMFVWKVSTIIEKFKKYLPDIWEKIEELSQYIGSDNEYENIKDIYPTIPKISIDYGIMERAKDVVVVPGDFGWNDVGSWDALGAIYKKDSDGNIIKGKHIGIDTKNSIVYGDKRVIATVGVDNVVVVETDDAILVCDKDKSQDVKKVVERLKKDNKMDLL